MAQPLLYAGYVYDRELHGPGEAAGWYWLSVRHYDPALGRFIQPDPSEQEGTRGYAYAGDDPLDATDPSGPGPFGTCIPTSRAAACPRGTRPGGWAPHSVVGAMNDQRDHRRASPLRSPP